jgi:hypothetical protein
MKKLIPLLALLCASASAQQPTTTVTGNIATGSGNAIIGTCTTQSAVSFTSGAGWSIVGAPRLWQIANGVLTMQLVPTDTSSLPATAYAKKCRVPLQTVDGRNCDGNAALVQQGLCVIGPFDQPTTYLQVPTSSSPVNLRDIESAATPAPITSQWRGNWSGSANYRMGDLVFCPSGGTCGSLTAGISFVAIQGGNTNHAPATSGTWWAPIHSRQSHDYDTFDMSPTGTWDFSGAARILPDRTGTGSPVGRDACAKSGESFFQTDATAGQNVFRCTAPGTPGTWTLSSGSVLSVAGRTGAVTLTKADVGLSLADNTADASKPVSTAQATAIAAAQAAAQAASLPLHGKADTAGAADTTARINEAVTVLSSASSPYTVLISDSYFACNATGGAVTITLPLATGTGRELTVKKTDSSGNACTLTRAGSSDLIDGATTVALTAQNSVAKVLDRVSAVWDRLHVNQVGGDATGPSTNLTVAKINGGSVPASAAFLGTNSSGQPIANAIVTDNGTSIVFSGRSVKGSLLACVGAPGNTAADYGTVCEVRSTGALWACTNSGGCTVSADWAAAGGGGSGGLALTAGAGDPLATCTAAGASNFPLYVDTAGKVIWVCTGRTASGWEKFLVLSNIDTFTLSGLTGTPPGTPTTTGNIDCWMDSTDKLLECRDDTQTVTKVGRVLAANVDLSNDVTTNNATTGHQGFLPKLSGVSTDVLSGTGVFGPAAPPKPDRTITVMQEWFSCSADNGAPVLPVGTYRWNTYSGAAAAVTFTGYGNNAPLCGVAIGSGASALTASTGRGIWLGGINSSYFNFPAIRALANYEFFAIVSLPSVTNTFAKFCIGDAAGSPGFQFVGTSICFVLDPTSSTSATNWVYRVTSDVDSGVTPGVATSTTNWYTFRLRNTGAAGVALMSVASNGGAFSSEVTVGTGQTINVALPNVQLIPGFLVGNNNTAANKLMNLHYFSAYITGNGR